AQELLDEMLRALSGTGRIELRVISGAALPEGEPLLTDVAAADARIAALEASSPGALVRAGATSFTGASTAQVVDLDDQLAVKDFEVEIAHGGEIFDPIVVPWLTGLRAIVRAARLPGATCVELAVTCVQAATPLRERMLQPKIWISTPLAIR